MRSATYLSGLALFLCAGTLVWGGDVETKSHPLTIEARVGQADFALYEPVYLRLSVKNNADHPVSVRYLSSTNTVGLNCKAKTPKGEVTLRFLGERGGPTFQTTLQPGESAALALNLLEIFDLTKHATTYSVGVLYDSGTKGQPVFEKRVSFAIRAASGKNWVRDNLLIQKSSPEAERLMERLKSKDFKGEDERQALLREYKELEAKWQVACYPKAYEKVAYRLALFYPEHPLRKYAYFWLGHERERNGFPETAIDCYQKLLKEYPEFPLKDEIFFRIQRLNIRSLRKTEDPLGELGRLLDAVADGRVRQMIQNEIDSLKRDAQKMGFASVKEFVLRDYQAEAEQHIPRYIRILKEHEDPNQRQLMVSIFMDLGTDSKEVVSALEKAAREDKDERVRKAAEEALKKIRENSAKP